MRRARISFPGSVHHVMSRGYQGNNLFSELAAKEYLLTCWQRFSRRQSMPVLAWCIMDNHYHMILQNPEDTLSRFMREVNGSFGIYYRSIHGGRGSVFDGRFRSTVIENPDYLSAAVRYLLQNPVRAGLAETVEQYEWSSIHELRNDAGSRLIDLPQFEAILGDVDGFLTCLHDPQNPPGSFPDRWGESVGSHPHRFHALRKSSRRKNASPELEERQRIQDRKTEKAGAALADFLRREDCVMEDLTGRNRVAARLRRKLLLILRDRCGLRLREIHKLEPYRHLGRNSLGMIYQVAVKEEKAEKMSR